MKEPNIEKCSNTIIHEDIIKEVKNKLIDEEKFCDMEQFFKVFADSTRIKIIWALSTHEMCVCDLACLLEMNHSAISHQLRVLKANRLVKYRKDGKVVYYSLDDEHISKIIACALEHINE